MTSRASIDVLVKSVAWETENVRRYELRRPDGSELPEFTPGAHVEVKTAIGGSRCYSLINQPEERDRYVIGVQRENEGRGGSRWICDTVRPGDFLKISAAKNNFSIIDYAPYSIFIAGGIGVTPLLCMSAYTEARGRPWELWYSARNRNVAAFLESLERNFVHGRVHLNFDEEPGGRFLDLSSIISAAPRGAHFYCCGPTGMLTAFKAASAHLSPDCFHLESFRTETPASTEGSFAIVVASTGETMVVPDGKTIIEVLNEAGFDVPSSCLEGICGTCETRVLDGIPDHKDQVLSEEEKARNDTMIICCSRCKGDRLVLDI